MNRKGSVLAMFKKSQKGIFSPLTGRIIPMADLPDPVFASGMLGESVGIQPLDKTVTLISPMEGIATEVSETGHAVGITAKDGQTAVLVHAGIDTVSMGGAGFTLQVRQGENVRVGQPILTMDVHTVEEAGYSSVVVVIVTETKTLLHPVTKEQIQEGEVLFTK